MCIKILMVDDHSMVRQGLKQLIELENEFEVIGEAGDGIHALHLVDELKPDIVLLDINMPEKNGIDTLKELKDSGCKTKVLMLTIHNETEYLIKAVEYGCDGYVLKDSSFEILKDAITTIIKDEKYIQPELIERLNEGLTSVNEDSYKLEQLTDREAEVLKLIAEGLFNKEIASKLDISERTVKNHISSIFKKIDVSDRTQAAVFAIKNNLVNIL